jgi:hypothetical protein
MPELSISTNAGGWFKAGFNVQCPEHICKVGKNIPQDVNDKQYLPVVMSVIRDIRTIFSNSKYFHLGSDERVASMPCFKEANKHGSLNFDVFENNLIQLLDMEGLKMDNIVRWQNGENTNYPDRAGAITQCRSEDCRVPHGKEWFATVDLREGGGWQIYQTTNRLALKKPAAILADFDRLDYEYFKENRIPLRMLAFTIGNLNLRELNRTEFEDIFNTLCPTFRRPSNPRRIATCAEFVASDDGIETKLERETEDYRHEYCMERTINGTNIVYRDDIRPYYLNQ